MPYLFTLEARYDNGKYIFSPSDLMREFPFLEGKIVTGRFISTFRDGRIKRIDREFTCKLKLDEYKTAHGEILDPNPLKAIGLPLPSSLLVTVYKYEEGTIEYPIAEAMVVMSSLSSYPFDEEIKRIVKEEEARLILEGTIFHSLLEKPVSTFKEALLSFDQKTFPSTKTSCRKSLEEIKRIVVGWKTVDNSESLCDKLKSVINSLYSFASIGGPHEGVTTEEETRLILRNTSSLIFYVNVILKNQRSA